jgi:hypothetical protein
MNKKLYIIKNKHRDYTDEKFTLREAIALIKQLPGKSALYRFVDYHSETELNKLRELEK